MCVLTGYLLVRDYGATKSNLLEDGRNPCEGFTNPVLGRHHVVDIMRKKSAKIRGSTPPRVFYSDTPANEQTE